MSTPAKTDKIDLNDIVNISEDEFKKQISAWIDERGVSRVLQSKLRADLFEQFNRTTLGRQMALQHQQTHRIVLSPLILVLNTLVAEFLYSENCHFTLSVFATEVPYKNTLPDFEATPSKQLFRFSDSELLDIFEAVGVSKQENEVLNRSLLYCIFKCLIGHIDAMIATNATQTIHKQDTENDLRRVKPLPTKSNENPPVAASSSAKSSTPIPKEPLRCAKCPRSHKKYEKFQISSRYFKYLNRYLDILSERVREISQSLAQKQLHKNGTKKESTAFGSSVHLESSVKADLSKLIVNLNHLTQSRRKSKKFQDIINSIERLSMSVEKCAGNLEGLINTNALSTATKQTAPENIAKHTDTDHEDRLKEIDYSMWLQTLKTSGNGRRFIDRLEQSLQKTMDKERENLEKMYEEKMNNYRMLIKLHYKQKYTRSEVDAGKGGGSITPRPITNVRHELTSIDSDELIAPTIGRRRQEPHVDQIVQTAKMRLQQLENESEKLDESFQAYLKRQHIKKFQFNQEISKIWENYNLGKAALAQHTMSTDALNLFSRNPNVIEAKVIQSDLNQVRIDDLDINEALKDLNNFKEFESPFKKLSINGLFLKRKTQTQSLNNNKDHNGNKQISKNEKYDKQHLNKGVKNTDCADSKQSSKDLMLSMPKERNIGRLIDLNENHTTDAMQANGHADQNENSSSKQRDAKANEINLDAALSTNNIGSISSTNNYSVNNSNENAEKDENGQMSEIEEIINDLFQSNNIKSVAKDVTNESNSSKKADKLSVPSTSTTIVNGTKTAEINHSAEVTKSTIFFQTKISSTESDSESQQISTGPALRTLSPVEF